jgi:hypothetical protein
MIGRKRRVYSYCSTDLPARNYFLVGKQSSTAKTTGSDDKEACAESTDRPSGVRRGLDDILRARELDPVQGHSGRLVYERLFGKREPTFHR